VRIWSRPLDTKGQLDFGIVDAEGSEIAGSNDNAITDNQTGVASRAI
jgi:hypothetical protein